MADGSKKSIEKLEKGDVVLGQDDAHNEVLEMETPDIGARKLYAFNGGDFFVTEEHPFWLKSGQWAAINPEATLKERKDFSELYGDIKKLEIGDILQLENNNFMTLEKIESRDRHNPKMPVYNPRLSGNKTYYANGFLVHNK